jgi:hypothetical protein
MCNIHNTNLDVLCCANLTKNYTWKIHFTTTVTHLLPAPVPDGKQDNFADCKCEDAYRNDHRSAHLLPPTITIRSFRCNTWKNKLVKNWWSYSLLPIWDCMVGTLSSKRYTTWCTCRPLKQRTDARITRPPGWVSTQSVVSSKPAHELKPQINQMNPEPNTESCI